MKHSIILLALILGGMPLKAESTTPTKTDGITLWVSPQGNDNGTGTAEAPFATLNKALETVRTMRANHKVCYTIVMRGGLYSVMETIKLTPADSGTPLSPTIITSADGEKAIISGGIIVNNWSESIQVEHLPDIAKGQVWAAKVPPTHHAPTFRQMWVGETKTKRASTFDDMSMVHLVSADYNGKNICIPTPSQDLSEAKYLEMTVVQDWATATLRIDDIHRQGNRSLITFRRPESEIEFKRPWPKLRASLGDHSNHCFYLSNAIELLNHPQEWYYDPTTNMIYYWPTSGERQTSVEATLPVVENLISIEGNEDQPVNNICFKGITFAHATWWRPSEAGNIPLQAGQYILDAYSDPSVPAGNVAWLGRPSAAINVEYAQHVQFENCIFKHTASTALDLKCGVKDASVNGCVFNDIGGTAILAGFFGDKEHEAHKAYNPTDTRDICDSLMIANNYIYQTGTEDWGCAGICLGYVSNATVSHNEIANTPYTAISMGWGWTTDSNCMHNNHILANYIHTFCNEMRDGGAIYTLSSQPNSSIENNRIENVGSPMFNPVMNDFKTAQYDLYLDEGTDYFMVTNNWCEREAVVQNRNGEHNVVIANNSKVANNIKNTAGLEKQYEHIKNEVIQPKYAPIDSIVEKRPYENIIEFVAQDDGFKLGAVLAADLNNDGNMDIVYGGSESNQVQHGGVCINKGEYGFATTQGLRKTYMTNFAAGDINGDNYVDIVQAGWDFWDNYNAVLLNNGHGQLGENELKTTKQTSPACGIADINNDGLSDYFFIGNGSDNSFYLQREDRTFSTPVSKLSLPGGFSDPNMIYADFNNDMNVDICLLSNKTGGAFTRIFFNDGEGHFKAKNVGFLEKGTRGSMAYADVNNDGYLDIAIGGMSPGEDVYTSDQNGGKTVILYINDGNDNFTKKQEFSEYLFDNVTQSVRFCDWDNDGHSDLIITGWNISYGAISQTDVFLNDGQGNFTKSDTDLPGVSESAIELADFSNSGKNDILITGNCNGGYNGYTTDRRIAVLCKNESTRINTQPLPPSNLSSEIKENDIFFSWDAGTDAETDSKALSYNIYLRDLSTGCFLISPLADLETGKRSVAQMGNTYLNKGWTLHNLPSGVYAWSVQSIDSGYAGSTFAPEQLLIIDYPNDEFDFAFIPTCF